MSTCYCGTSRAAVEGQARREEQKNAPDFTALALLGGAMVIVVVGYLTLTRHDASPTPKPSAAWVNPVESTPNALAVPTRSADASERPDVGVVVAPQPRAPAGERRGVPTPIPVLAPPRTPSPTPSAQPERSEVDIERDAGERRLERTLATLEVEKISLSANTREFESVCLSTRGEPSSCERLFNDISSGGEALGRRLEGAEEDARRSWVSPGFVRDLRGRHGLDESTWTDLANRVHRLTTQYRGGS